MIASATTIGDRTPADCRSITSALVQTLRELREVIARVNAQQYAARAGEPFANSSMGGHVRHTLDHVRAVVDGWRLGTIDYDHRERGTCIEIDLNAADVELGRLICGLEHLSQFDADEPVAVIVMPARDGASLTLASTLGREVAFVLSHTVHHNATVRGIVMSLGCHVPPAFGYAPSTLAHQDASGKSACAR